MSPGSPCPFPGCPPVAKPGLEPVDPALIAAAQARGAMLVGQLVSKFDQSVQQAIQGGTATVTDLLGKFDAAVSAGAAAGQQVIGNLAALHQMSVLSQAPPPGGLPGSGGTAQQGARPGQYAYDLYQYGVEPWGIDILPSGQLPRQEQHPACFIAGFDNVYDAVNFVRANQGHPPPDWCLSPGGTAGPTKPACDTGLYQVYQTYTQTGDTQTLTGCTIRCSSDPAPAQASALGNPVSWDIALGLFASTNCGGGSGGIKPPPTTNWYAGCDAKGNPVTWSQDQTMPAGTTGVTGPYPDQTVAGAAALTICQPGSGKNGTGGPCPPTQVTCPPPTVNVTCPPSTGGGPGTQNITLKVQWPDCLMVDLCDWTKFRDALVDALCEWYDRCVCKLENEPAYMLADCDEKYAGQMNSWFGGIGGQVTGASSMDAIVEAGAGSFRADGSATISDLPW